MLSQKPGSYGIRGYWSPGADASWTTGIRLEGYINNDLPDELLDDTPGPVGVNDAAERTALFLGGGKRRRKATRRSARLQRKVQMSFVGAKIVQTALSQHGKDDKDCPKDGCYSAKGKEWCSEFVSWVYNEADVPFTGGRKGGWLLVDTGKIRRWFKKNRTYIERDDPGWDEFVPSPGDYVFIGRAGRPRRKHSGLVRRVRGTSLETIEGNNKGREVDEYFYPNFKINTTNNATTKTNGIVLGFGVR